jgi:hypothetical protein
MKIHISSTNVVICLATQRNLGHLPSTICQRTSCRKKPRLRHVLVRRDHPTNAPSPEEADGRGVWTVVGPQIGIVCLATPSTGQLASQESQRPDIRMSLMSTLDRLLRMLTKGQCRLMDHDPPSEKHSTLNLSRLYGGTIRKASGRPSTSDGSTSAISPKELRGTKEKEEKKEKEKKAKTTEKGIKDEKEIGPSVVLRKRPELNGEIPPRSMQPLKPGQSVLEQIGEPDHKGWMRKKGDRYNSWKSRYFVLKGPHLYILKSEDKSVSVIYYPWVKCLVLRPFGCPGN